MKLRQMAWLKLIAMTLFLPLVILALGSWYMGSLGRELKLRAFETDADEILESMRYVAGTEKYLCNSIAAIYDQNPGGDQLKQAIEQFLAKHQLSCRYLIWGENGSVHYSNFDWQKIPGDWREAFAELNLVRNRKYGADKMPQPILQNLRNIFGQHFFPRYYHQCFTGRDLNLLRTDASKQAPLVWLNVNDDYGLSIFLDHKVLESDCGLQNFAVKTDHQIVLGYIDSGRVVSENASLAAELQPHADKLRGSFKRIHEIAGYQLVANFISRNITGFCAMKNSEISLFTANAWFNVALAVMFLVMLLFSILSYHLIVRQASVTMRLTRQLLLLFVVSNLLPGFVLLVIGSDYLQQMRHSLISSAFNQSNSYLQNIDELYISEQTVQDNRLEMAQPRLVASLAKNEMNRRSIRGFLNKQQPEPYRLFLVASDTGLVAGSRGILKDGKLHEAFFKGFKNDRIRINTLDALYKVGNYALNTLNKKAVAKKIGTEVEFIAESLTQKKPAELVQIFIAVNKFWEWSIGSKKHPTYLKFLKIFNDSSYDYLLLYLWDAYDLEISYISRVYHSLNRNEFGLRIIAVDERFEKAFPPEALQDQRIREFSLKLRDRTITRPEFCNIDGTDYLLAGHKCIFMQTMRLLALYPIERINDAISGKRYLLLMFVLISILVSVSLGLFVSGSILGPLGALQIGVEALKNRDFAHRLPDLGGDEFGHLARIFNETLIDLEEMHVATIVQEKIMTQMNAPLQSGNLHIYGRTISLSGMGGDYFELFEAVDSHPAVLLGDVAGRGVATSLILAFIKSAVLQLHGASGDPEKFMRQLNRVMTESSRSGQRKSFACQYLCFSGDDRINLVNAGLPYPMIIDHQRLTVSALAVPALPLGCSSAFIPGKIELQLPAGQSLVCFSSGFFQHGLIEYDKIIDLIRNSVNQDPQQFCKNCFDNYFLLADRASCKDDVSLLIIHHPEASNGNQNS